MRVKVGTHTVTGGDIWGRAAGILEMLRNRGDKILAVVCCEMTLVIYHEYEEK
jgi:hypothetical protein